MFYLVRVTPQEVGLLEEPLPDCGTFETGLEASRAAKQKGLEINAKVQPRRIAQAGDWRPREQAIYDAIPDELRLPDAWDLKPIPDHFARRLSSISTLISYVANPADGVIGKFTQQAVGRYLARFYPRLGQEDLKRYIAMVDPSGTVCFATTVFEVEMVYREGPDSCIKGDRGVYAIPEGVEVINGGHTARIYAGPDLAVAYLRDRSGRITARAVCWPEKKVFGRCYGDMYRLSEKLTDEEGFTRVVYLPGGAIVHPCEVKIHGMRHFALPYWDNIVGLKVDEDGTIRTLEYNETAVRYLKRDATQYGNQISTVCPFTGLDVPEDSLVEVHGYDKRFMSLEAANDGNAWRCALSGAWFYLSVPKVWMMTGVPWSSESFAAHGATCPFTGGNYSRSTMIMARDGYLVSPGSIEDYHKMLDQRTAPTVFDHSLIEGVYDAAA